MSADRNLLFGILALQNNFVTREQLVEAMNAWTIQRQRALGDILLDRSALTAETKGLLDALVAMQLKQHHGDVEKSIQALEVSSATCQALRHVPDQDVQQSLTGLTIEKPVSSGEETTGVTHRANARFRILRPHARGGLGEVFVAHDLELHREVALKEIQPQHADNDLSRGRFVQEAEVTGGLEHPNIVPVYGLGTYADGRPYYAMRFIRGDSLKEAIEHFFQTKHESEAAENLAFRNLLKRFVDVCDAIAYAHSRGILHRDLKPGNIMLGKYGETLVVDWGLAKPVSKREGDRSEQSDERTLVPQSRGDSVETMHGSAVGTPAYFSPEQAMGRLDLMGPASDVYSLGATLYVLLTGKLPFSGPVNEIIRKVEKGDFARPREVKPKVPEALDAVVMRAMSLRPEERYPSATALGQEIERYLADEPVQAFKEPFAARAKRWLRRHPGMVSGVVATVLVGLGALGTGLYVVNGEKNRTALARDIAEEARDEARANFDMAVKARDQAFDALRSMTDEVVERKFAAGQGTRLTEDDKTFLRGVIKQYDTFASIQGNDAESRAVRGEGRNRVGTMRFRLGELKEAEQDWNIALGIYKQLVEEFPRSVAYHRSLAGTHLRRGNLLIAMGRMKEAEQDFNAALEVYKQLAVAFPERSDFRHELAGSHYNRGRLLFSTGRSKEVEQDWNTALEIRKQLVVEFPKNVDFRQELANSHKNRGLLLEKTGRMKEAEQDYDAALVIYKQLAEELPARAEVRRDLAGTYLNRGILMRMTGRLQQAERDYTTAVESYKQLAEEFPKRSEFRHEWARSHNNRGNLLAETDRVKEAQKDYEAALGIHKKLVAEFPNQPDFRNSLAAAYVNLALLLQQQGDRTLAKKHLLEGRPHHLAALQSNPQNPVYRQFFQNHLRALIAVHAGLLEKDEAVRTAMMRSDMGWDPPTDAFDAARLLSQGIPVVAKIDKLDEAKRKELTQFYGDEAMKLLREAAKRGYKDLATMKKEKDLDPLRGRKDFQDLLAEMDKAPPAQIAPEKK